MSIVTIPEGTSFQYGDAFGNIAHQGVLSSNINKTTILTSTTNSSFPTTSTGDSLGHYHYTESTTNALKFLNSSGTGQGGHQFWNSNSTDAPIKYFEVNRDNATLNTQLVNDTGNTRLDMTNNLLSLSSSSNNIQMNASQSNLQVRNNATSDASNMICDRISVGNDINNTSMSIFSTLTRMSDPQYWNTNTTSNLVINKLGTTEQSELTTKKLTLHDANTNVSMLSPSSLLIDDGNNNTSFNDTTGLTTRTATAVSILSATDLTFNGTSLKTQVSTNTTNIGTNTSNIDTLTIKQTTTSLQYISAAIYADGRPPTAPTATITQQYAFTPAWYFKNTVAGYKINWYMGGDLGMTVSQVLGLYMNMFNPSMTSNDNCPFITVYTVNDTPNPPNFYKSKRTYLFNQSVTPVVNTRYFMYRNVSGTCPTPFHYGSVLNNMELSTVSGSNVGAFGPTETILAFAIGSNSASAVNSVEFAINKFGIMTPYGTQEISFLPST